MDKFNVLIGKIFRYSVYLVIIAYTKIGEQGKEITDIRGMLGGGGGGL